ncbi:hypothetical protein N7466_000851 [Penicillium verhagenii]|uniref:uncharacterized protein n=1 Tax=Penicillium verhagenii TaxID=1562060 RepID=UPI00254518F0|nr:uncharacterized protein N7466_000851 [Penicillium verhagenii]KAJ5947836.1 hypothetical protein N7466_000851 [Penicillium verhagenii]
MFVRSILLGGAAAVGASAMLVVPEMEAQMDNKQLESIEDDFVQIMQPVYANVDFNMMLNCDECPFREVNEEGVVSWTDDKPSALYVNFRVEDNRLLANDQQIFPPVPPGPITVTQIARDSVDESSPVTVGYALEVMPHPRPADAQDADMLDVRLTILDLESHPVPVDTIAITLILTPTGDMFLADGDFEKSTGHHQKQSWKQCHGKPKCLQELLFSRIHDLFSSAKDRVMGMGGKGGCKGMKGMKGMGGHHKQHDEFGLEGGKGPHHKHHDDFDGEKGPHHEHHDDFDGEKGPHHEHHDEADFDGEKGPHHEHHNDFDGEKGPHHEHHDDFDGEKGPHHKHHDEADFDGEKGPHHEHEEGFMSIEELEEKFGSKAQGHNPWAVHHGFNSEDAEGRPPRPHHMHGGPHGAFAHTFSRVVRFIVVPAILGVLAGLTASAVGMLVGQAVIFLWQRYRGTKKQEHKAAWESGNVCEKQGLMTESTEEYLPEYTEEASQIRGSMDKN